MLDASKCQMSLPATRVALHERATSWREFAQEEAAGGRGDGQPRRLQSPQLLVEQIRRDSGNFERPIAIYISVYTLVHFSRKHALSILRRYIAVVLKPYSKFDRCTNVYIHIGSLRGRERKRGPIYRASLRRKISRFCH